MPGRKRTKRTRNADETTHVVQPSQKRTRGADTADHVEVIELGQQNSQSGEQKGIPMNAEHTPYSHTPSIQKGNSSHFVDFETLMNESNLIPTRNEDPQSTLSPSDPSVVNFQFEEDSLRLGGEDMTAHVPQQLCQKIWAHQYINIALLLKGNVELQDLCSGGLVHITEKGQIETRPKIVKDKVPNIDKWTDAFLIFTSIYLKKYPGKAQELLQYRSIIREAASRSPSSLSWRSYDEQFRIRQSTTVQSWGKLNPDLWLRVMTAMPSSTQSNVTPFTKGACLDFNSSTCFWNPCRYNHVCSNCGGQNHGRLNCFKLQGSALANRGGFSFRRFRGYHTIFHGGRPFSRRGNKQ